MPFLLGTHACRIGLVALSILIASDAWAEAPGAAPNSPAEPQALQDKTTPAPAKPTPRARRTTSPAAKASPEAPGSTNTTGIGESGSAASSSAAGGVSNAANAAPTSESPTDKKLRDLDRRMNRVMRSICTGC